MESTVDVATIPQRVAAGAAWLDQHQPGWWQRINLEWLDMSMDCGCVLGQLVGTYDHAVAILQVPDPDGLGFHVYFDWQDPGAYFAEYDALTAEWRRVIVARRGQAGA